MPQLFLRTEIASPPVHSTTFGHDFDERLLPHICGAYDHGTRSRSINCGWKTYCEEYDIQRVFFCLALLHRHSLGRPVGNKSNQVKSNYQKRRYYSLREYPPFRQGRWLEPPTLVYRRLDITRSSSHVHVEAPSLISPNTTHGTKTDSPVNICVYVCTWIAVSLKPKASRTIPLMDESIPRRCN